MANLNGKWLLLSSDNTDAYLTVTHAPPEFKKNTLALLSQLSAAPNVFVQEIVYNKSAGTMQFRAHVMGQLKHDSTAVPVGKEVDNADADGRTSKIKATVESDSKMLVDKKGSDHEAHGVYVVNGDEMTVTKTCSGVTCTEKYKRV